MIGFEQAEQGNVHHRQTVPCTALHSLQGMDMAEQSEYLQQLMNSVKTLLSTAEGVG